MYSYMEYISKNKCRIMILLFGIFSVIGSEFFFKNVFLRIGASGVPFPPPRQMMFAEVTVVPYTGAPPTDTF